MQKRVALVRSEGLAPGEEQQKRQVPGGKLFELASASVAIDTPGMPEQAKEDQRKSTTLKGGTYMHGSSRRATQTIRQRKPSSIVTPEQYTYVKRDLIHIAILSSGMVGVMIVLAFILGIE
jgi:hypothetical protein